MKVVAIVQARIGSIRLPNKVLKPLVGMPMIEILLKRLSKSKLINEIVLATSIDKKNTPLLNHVKSLGFTCKQGSEDDVLERYFQVAQETNADVIVRITGDCPLVDPDLVDECISSFQKLQVDYCSNTIKPTYPDGLDVEVVKFSALKAAEESTRTFIGNM